MQQVFWIEFILFFYLVLASVEDVKRKEIDIRILFVFLLLSISLLSILDMNPFTMGRLVGVFPGAVLAAISRISRGAVGMGDALVVMWLGYVMGIMSCLSVLASAWLICFVAAAICWLRRKKGAIPFIPFLCTGFYLHIWVSYISL